MPRRFIAVVFLAAATTASAQVWIRGDLPLEAVGEVAAHPTLPGIAFAATVSGTYCTTDGGSHWQRVAFVLSSFAFNPFRDEVCALRYGGLDIPDSSGIYCSADLGVTWSERAAAGVDNLYWFLLFDPRVPDRMYSGVGYGYRWIARSDDAGRTWTIHGSTPSDSHPNFHGWAAIDRDSTLYVTSYPHGGGGYWRQPVYRSRDGGDTWEITDIGADRWLVAVDAMTRSALYAAFDVTAIPPQRVGDPYDYDIRASTDAGATWQAGHLRMSSSINALSADRMNNAILYAGGDSGIVFRSPDGGRTWIQIDHGQVHESATSNFQTDSVHIISVGIDGTVYAATSDAVFAMRSDVRKRAAR